MTDPDLLVSLATTLRFAIVSLFRQKKTEWRQYKYNIIKEHISDLQPHTYIDDNK